jgi:serine/threonine protein phosphatase PrpC
MSGWTEDDVLVEFDTAAGGTVLRVVDGVGGASGSSLASRTGVDGAEIVGEGIT